MKRGRDYRVPVPKRSLAKLLFSRELPGLVFYLNAVTFCNWSILGIAIVGALLERSFASVAIVAFAGFVLGQSTRISHLWNNAVTLKAVRAHVDKYSDCTFQVLSNADLEGMFQFKVGFRLVNDLSEVRSFYQQISRPLQPFKGENSIRGVARETAAEVASQIFAGGYRFIIATRGPRRARELATFASRDFRFVFLKAPKRGLFLPGRFGIAHEIGHMNAMSVASYFNTESMMRCIIALPFLACCLVKSWLPLVIGAAVMLVYVYLRWYAYPGKRSAAYLRDEITADRAAVWTLPIESLKMMRDSLWREFVKGDRNIEGAPDVFQSDRTLSEIEEYRYELLMEEISRKEEKPQDGYSWLDRLVAQTDRQGNVIAPGGAAFFEGLIGMAFAVLAFRFYGLTSISWKLGMAISISYLLIAWALSRFVADRYRCLKTALEQRQWIALAKETADRT